MIDVQEKKKKIISFLEENGPSLPVQIGRAIQMDPMFASAILSELLGTKQIKLSNTRVGSSPLYLLPGHEIKLEGYTDNLKPVEKEAYIRIKERRIMDDEEESPMIRVALRNIKDFAIPFKFREKIMWRYAFATEEEIQKLLNPQEKKEVARQEYENKKEEVPKAWEVKKDEIKKAKEESKKIEPILKKKVERESKSDKPTTFLKQIEEFLGNRGGKFISIQEVDKKRVVARIHLKETNALLFAFNKKKIMEDELIKCYKEAKLINLPYYIIISGELTKKMNETIDAYKKLIKIDKLDN